MAHELDGSLVVCLVEGIKGKDRQFVEVGETKLGPYFPVQVDATSRYAEVRFSNAFAFFVYDESYEMSDPELKKDTGRFLFVAELSSFKKLVEATTVAQILQQQYQEFLLGCEDRLFHVLSSEVPSVTFLNKQPNLAVERTSTWSAT